MQSQLTLEDTIERGLETIFSFICALSLPYSTMYIASNILQRSYKSSDVQRRFKDRKYYDVAAGSLFIALKLEEYKINNDEIINVINRKAKKQEELFIKADSPEYSRWKRIVLYMEPYLLHQLNFRMELSDPFGLLTMIRRQYGIPFSTFQLTHTIIGDCCRTSLCIKADDKLIVSSCLYLTGCILDIQPYNEINSDLWGISQFKSVTLDALLSFGNEMVQFYAQRQEIAMDLEFTPLSDMAEIVSSQDIVPIKDDELEEGEMQL